MLVNLPLLIKTIVKLRTAYNNIQYIHISVLAFEIYSYFSNCITIIFFQKQYHYTLNIFKKNNFSNEY